MESNFKGSKSVKRAYNSFKWILIPINLFVLIPVAFGDGIGLDPVKEVLIKGNVVTLLTLIDLFSMALTAYALKTNNTLQIENNRLQMVMFERVFPKKD